MIFVKLLIVAVSALCLLSFLPRVPVRHLQPQSSTGGVWHGLCVLALLHGIPTSICVTTLGLYLKASPGNRLESDAAGPRVCLFKIQACSLQLLLQKACPRLHQPPSDRKKPGDA